MKLFKANVYFYDTDYSDDTALNCFKTILENDNYISARIFDIKGIEIGEFYDEIPLNYINCTKEQCENFFTADKEVKALVEDIKTKNIPVEEMELRIQEIINKSKLIIE